MRLVFAYLDPVTGGALFQIILGMAAVAGLGYQYVKKWGRSLFARLRPEVEVTEESRSAPLGS